jgi:hypothetical protein
MRAVAALASKWSTAGDIICSSEVRVSRPYRLVAGSAQLLQVFKFFTERYPAKLPSVAGARRGQQQRKDQSTMQHPRGLQRNHHFSTYGWPQRAERLSSRAASSVFRSGGIILPVTGRLQLGCNNDSIWVTPVRSKTHAAW